MQQLPEKVKLNTIYLIDVKFHLQNPMHRCIMWTNFSEYGEDATLMSSSYGIPYTIYAATYIKIVKILATEKDFEI